MDIAFDQSPLIRETIMSFEMDRVHVPSAYRRPRNHAIGGAVRVGRAPATLWWLVLFTTLVLWACIAAPQSWRTGEKTEISIAPPAPSQSLPAPAVPVRAQFRA